MYSITCYSIHCYSQYVNIYINTDVSVVFHNALPTASPLQQMPFPAFLLTCVHLISPYIIHHSSSNVTAFFFHRIRGRDYINLFLSTKPLKKTWLTVSNRVVPGWKGFEVAFRKSQALQETVGKEKTPGKLGDACRNSVTASVHSTLHKACSFLSAVPIYQTKNPQKLSKQMK